MGILADVIGGIREDQVPNRWVTVIPADPAIESPAFEVQLAYIKESDFNRLTSPFKDKKTGNLNVTDDNAPKFKKGYLRAAVKGWRGAVPANLRKLGPAFLNADLSSVDPKDGLPFSVEDLVSIGEAMVAGPFNTIMEESLDYNAFVAEVNEKQKND